MFPSVLINHDTFKSNPEPMKDINAFIDSLDGQPCIVVLTLTTSRYYEATEECSEGHAVRNWVFAYRTGSTYACKWEKGAKAAHIKKDWAWYGEQCNYWPTYERRWPIGDEPTMLQCVIGVVGVFKDPTRDHEDDAIVIANTIGKSVIMGRVYPCGQIQ